jgi:hypothetical protein
MSPFFKKLSSWILGSALAACGGSSSGTPGSGAEITMAPHPFGIEVIVRTAENFATAADVTQFVALAAQNSVTRINLLVKQDEDGSIASGQVFYRSAIAPSAPGYTNFDVLQAMLDASKAHNIRVRAWIPQFHDQVAAKLQPAWQMMAASQGRVAPYTGTRNQEYFVNPLHPEVQAYELSLVQEVTRRYPVDGVMLDWIRFDNYNMDLSDTTRQQYLARFQVDPLTLDFSKPSAALSQWNDYRTDGIAAYVQRVRNALPANMPLGVYVLPPEFVEVAQDAGKFNTSIDSLGPMCYFVDWGFSLNWVWSSCLSTTAQKSGQADIVPAMDSQLSDAQYQQIFSHLRSDFPQIKTLSWFHHGKWTPELFQRIARLSHF